MSLYYLLLTSGALGTPEVSVPSHGGLGGIALFTDEDHEYCARDHLGITSV